MKLLDIPLEMIMEILSNVYPIDYCGIKLNMKLLNKNEYNVGRYENTLLEKSLKNIIKISYVCKCLNNIISRYGLKVLYFKNKVNMKVVRKHKSKYLIAPNNKKLSNNVLKLLTNLTHIYLPHCKKMTDEGIKLLTNITFLSLIYNDLITDEGIKPLTNLTYLNLNRNKKITDEGIKPLTKLDICYVNRRRLK